MKCFLFKNQLSLALILSLSLTFVFQSFVNSSQSQNITNNEITSDSFIYRKISNTAFGLGEKLSFRIHYGFINAAIADIEVDGSMTNVDGRNTIHVRAEGKTNSSFDWMYKVRDKFETWIDQDAICPLKYYKTVREDNYKDQDLVMFRHQKKKLFGTKGNMDIKPYTQDIISAVFYARNIDFTKSKVGDTYPISVYLDNKIYNLQFKFGGRETISSDVGKVKCIKLIPKLVVDRVFKGEEDMTIWISDDLNKIPIRVKSAIQVGSVKCDLTKYSGLKNSFSALTK